MGVCLPLLCGFLPDSVPSSLCAINLIVQSCHGFRRDTIVWTAELKSCCTKIDLLIDSVSNRHKYQEDITLYL
jgi:hypothetical protein